MLEKEIIEGNVLIAEFLGARKYNSEFELYGVVECIEDGVDEKHFFYPHELLFHSDWNWLMPVIEKIEFCNYSKSSTVTPFTNLMCSSLTTPNRYSMEIEAKSYGRGKAFYENGESKIQVVWKTAVQFINWYNIHKND